MIVAYSSLETAKKVDDRFLSEILSVCWSLHTHSRVKFITEEVALFFLRHIPRFANLQNEWMRLSSITIPPNTDRITFTIRIQDILHLQREIDSTPMFATNTKRKNYFPEACKCINPHIDLYDVNVKSPFGCPDRVNDFQLERIFSFQRICGCMQCFMIRLVLWADTLMRDPGFFCSENILQNYWTQAFLRHIAGIFYCCFLNFLNRNLFESFMYELVKTESKFESFPNEQR